MLVPELEMLSNVGTYPVECLGHYSASTGIRFISERYQANARLSPSSKSTLGSQPNSFRALEKSPQLLGISTRRASGFQRISGFNPLTFTTSSVICPTDLSFPLAK